MRWCLCLHLLLLSAAVAFRFPAHSLRPSIQTKWKERMQRTTTAAMVVLVVAEAVGGVGMEEVCLLFILLPLPLPMPLASSL